MKNYTEEDIESSFFQSLRENVTELSLEVGEITFDQVLNNEILKEIPLFSILYKTFKISTNIRDTLFTMKMYKFLNEFSKIKIESKDELLRKIDENRTERNRIGHTLIMIIEKFDDFEKTQILANLFAAYIESNITKEELIYLSSIVQQSFMNHLNLFLKTSKYEELPNEVQNSLSSVGLMQPFLMKITDIYISLEISNDKTIIAYGISDIGKKFRKFALR